MDIIKNKHGLSTHYFLVPISPRDINRVKDMMDNRGIWSVSVVQGETDAKPYIEIRIEN